MMHIVELEETASTNTWVKANREALPMPSLVFARRQTAGRGQRGNSWESEPYKNLCASVLIHPAGVEPQRQFSVSEAVALAVVDFLEESGVEAKVKWPNDIYVGERKICGILIENAVMPHEILYTIAGVGINLNQERFISDAPNPVSLTQLTGKRYVVEEAAESLARLVERRIRQTTDDPDGLHSEFIARMWRGDGKFYPFFDRIRGERIEGRIADVASKGILTLDLGNEHRSYAFKEVEFLLTDIS